MNATATRPLYKRRPPKAAPYALLNDAERYLHETRDDALLALLRRHGVATLAGRRILELGCGAGSLLRSLLHYGAEPGSLHGLDIDGEAIATSRSAVPGVALERASAAGLPYRNGAFDLAFAFTMFSSIRDQDARRQAAAEAMRVLRPGGLIIIYDFRLNPTNRRTRPLGARELRTLFPAQRVEIERVTLAPPLVRLLRGRRALLRPLERALLLRTHLLAAVVKEA